MTRRSVLGRAAIRFFETVVKRRRTFEYLRELQRSQWQPREALERQQFSALTDLIRYTFEHSPYYRREWEARGLTPDLLAHPNEFLRWPVINQDTVREHRFTMRTAAPGRLIAKATGGSTGTPVSFDLNLDSNDRRVAASFRGYGWAGAEPGTKQLHLWGGAVGDQPGWKRAKQALYDRLYRRRVLDCFRYGPDRAQDFVAELTRYRPDVIVAYVNPIYEFARVIGAHHVPGNRLRAIVVGAEKLHDFQRTCIASSFGAPVFETYGSREFMLIGAECEQHAGLHLTMEHLLVEILDDEGRPTPDGREGNVVVTDLFNYGMPFVRYSNGDRAVAGFSDCTCGRGLPLLKKVVGRRLDVLALDDGRNIPGEFFPHLIKDVAAIRRFQVIQSPDRAITLRLVVEGADSGGEVSRLGAAIRDVIGDRVPFSIERVDDIPLTSAGKHLVVVNLATRRLPDDE